MLNIVTISDTHDQHDKLLSKNLLPKGDMIIHAGDCTGRGETSDIEEFLRWYGDLDYQHKILVAGNHDWGFERDPEYHAELCKNYGVTYLNDSGVTIKGLKIWGSPVQPWFFSWAFNRGRDEHESTIRNIPEIQPHWDQIPDNVDILITHSPAYGYGDQLRKPGSPSVGCESLRNRIEQVRPVLHVFGHIHESRGVYPNTTPGKSPITHVNASSLDHKYRLWNKKAFVFNWNDLVNGKV